MMLTLILLAIGALLFLVIGYNIVQQYKQKSQADKKRAIDRQKAIIDEVEQLLLNVNVVPYSKMLILVLQQRMLEAYRTILTIFPHQPLKDRMLDVQQQIKHVQEHYQVNDDGLIKNPESDRHALQMLQLIKKLRVVLRLEHNKGKIDPQSFAKEDRRLELMLLKINIMNLQKKAHEAYKQNQYGTCQQLYQKGLTVLSHVMDKDIFLQSKEDELQKAMQALSEILRQNSTEHEKLRKEKRVDELDILFQPKRKW